MSSVFFFLGGGREGFAPARPHAPPVPPRLRGPRRPKGGSCPPQGQGFQGHPVQDYYRQLDLTNATASVVYKSPDKSVTYTREYIASNPDQVVAMRLKASEPGKLSLRFTMESGKPGIKADTEYKDGYACFKGKLQTVSYNARLKVIPTGGHIETTDEGITVKAADEILVILGGGTDFDAYAPNYVSATSELEAKVLQKVDAAAQKGWEQLYEDHVADYGSLFGRVHLNLEGAKNNLPTDELIKKYAQRSTGTEDYALMLEALYFNYGRYLMLGSSLEKPSLSSCPSPWHCNPVSSMHELSCMAAPLYPLRGKGQAKPIRNPDQNPGHVTSPTRTGPGTFGQFQPCPACWAVV